MWPRPAGCCEDQSVENGFREMSVMTDQTSTESIQKQDETLENNPCPVISSCGDRAFEPEINLLPHNL